MSEFVAAAERFRLVKDAYHDFITLWALDCALEQPLVADRIYSEVMGVKDSRFFGRSGLYPMGGLDD
jgi:hypothetical protein